jgi:hypothetical protein
MPTAEIVLSDLATQYPVLAGTDAFLRLYTEPEPISAVFASFHERLNALFLFLNTKQTRGGHFNAEQSRELIDLIAEMSEVRTTLARVGIGMELRADYQKIVEDCSAFLVPSGGSAIPPGFEPIAIERYEPVFSSPGEVPRPKPKQGDVPKAVMVGEGAFAIVYKYMDEDYGFNVALKAARRGISERDLERFKKEYEILRSLSFPYIVEAYAYDASKSQYSMEYCDSTLGDYIRDNNDKLSWSTRKRIALQFLYGINYLHIKEVMHRDISRRNVLIKKYDLGAVVVKLSDFGLYKGADSEFTKVDSSLKGTIIDPTLDTFKDFTYTNDIYAVGHVLSFIFTGKVPLGSARGEVQDIVAKCTDNIVAHRYATVAEIITAVDSLPAPEVLNSTEAPA